MIHRPSSSTLEQYFETLRCIVAELGPQRSFHSSLRRILTILAQRHAFIRPHLVIYDPEARTLRLCVAGTPPTAEGSVYEPGSGVTGQVFTLGQPVIVECIKDSAVFQNKFFIRSEEEMAELAFVCLPVFATRDGSPEAMEVLGTLSVDIPRRPRPELEEACRFLEVVARLIGNQVAYLQQEVHQQAQPSARPQDGAFAENSASMGIVCQSKRMQQTIKQVSQAGQSRANILLCGERGSGKELLAEWAHWHSVRRHMPLQKLHCAALSPLSAHKAEVLFFGVQKGAFPWAVQSQKGLLEQAHLGTLFLDGLENLPPVLHEGLLRAVQEQEVLRLGAAKPLPVDVRLVCSTSCPSGAALCGAAALPETCLQALCGVEIAVPPLREHSEDILPLAEHFLLEAAAQQGKAVRRISQPALSLLLCHSWPGNGLELKNCMARAVARCGGTQVQPADLPPSLQADAGDVELPPNFVDAVAQFEQQLLKLALRKAKGNIVEVSRLLSTSYRIIHYKITKYGIDPKRWM